MPLKDNSNEDLMILYQDGSFEAFHELYRRYSKRAYGYFIKNTKSELEAEDLLQKHFLKFHSSKELYKKDYLFEQWFFIIARSVLYDHLRQNKNRQKLSYEDLGWDFGYKSVDDEVANSHYPNIIKHLSIEDQEILRLKYVEDLSYKEMTIIFQKTEISLRQMVSRALKKAKKGII